LVRAARAETATTPSQAQPVASEPQPEVELDSARLVVIADPDEARGKVTAEAIRNWGLSTILVHDGVEAMLSIQRALPAAIILDAALPKMFGFQVCEIVKRNESLRDTTVILVGAIHHQDRYRRDPSELYGADVYIEDPDLPDGLNALLREAGLDVAELNLGDAAPEVKTATTATTPRPPAPPAPSGPPTPTQVASDPIATPEVTARSVEPVSSGQQIVPPTAELTQPSPQSTPTPPEPVMDAAEVAAPVASATAVAEDPERTAERERACRLARIAVSEMVLYQPEKFDQANRDGVLEQALDLEIQEARALLRQRIGDEVRAETDFIIDELHRVAKKRGEQG
jgi:CheY-like chemotaxis protein